jgi:hypothetical protein
MVVGAGDGEEKAIVVASFKYLDQNYYVSKSKSDWFNVWENARPIPKTLPLTISELLNIASEVKGVQVTLKEEKQ